LSPPSGMGWMFAAGVVGRPMGSTGGMGGGRAREDRLKGDVLFEAEPLVSALLPSAKAGGD